MTSDNSTQVTASLHGAGPLQGTTTITVSGGIGRFTNLADNKAESIILMFTAAIPSKAQSGPITVNPAAASRLSITAPATAITGRPFTITVTALDAFNNVANGYRGTVYFTSTDKLAILPAGKSFTFTARDAGVHTFGNAVRLTTPGTQTITARSVFSPSIAGSVSVLANSPPLAAALSRLAAIDAGNDDDRITAKRAGTVDRPHFAVTLRSGRSMGVPALAPSPHSITANAVRADPSRNRIPFWIAYTSA